MYQSQNITDLLESLTIIRSNRLKVAGICTFAWTRLQHADDYLQLQIDAHFAEPAESEAK